MSQRGLDWNHANYNRDNMKVVVETIITNIPETKVDSKSQKHQDHDEFEDVPELIDLPEPKEPPKLEPTAMEFETLFYPNFPHWRRY